MRFLQPCAYLRFGSKSDSRTVEGPAVERVSAAVDFNSGPGRLLVAVGFFGFVGFVIVALVVGLIAQRQYNRGESNINPLGWTAAGFLILLLLSLVRTCEEGPPTYK